MKSQNKNTPRFFCGNIWVAENLCGIIPPIGRNRIPGRSVSVTHHLKKLDQTVVGWKYVADSLKNTYENVVASPEWIFENCLRTACIHNSANVTDRNQTHKQREREGGGERERETERGEKMEEAY